MNLLHSLGLGENQPKVGKTVLLASTNARVVEYHGFGGHSFIGLLEAETLQEVEGNADLQRVSAGEVLINEASGIPGGDSEPEQDDDEEVETPPDEDG